MTTLVLSKVTCRICGAKSAPTPTGKVCGASEFVAYCCTNGHVFQYYVGGAA